MPRSIADSLQESLDKRAAANTLRSLRAPSDAIDFTSNDYLGLASSASFARNIAEKYIANSMGTGSGGSRLLSGSTVFVEELEKNIATFHHAEAGLIFNSGYDANIGLFSSVPKRGDTILYDELIHASVRDGIRLSLTQSFSFIHNDIEDLKKKLLHAKGNIFIAIESIYSMDGDLAPLQEVINLAKEHEAVVIIDEAHAIGVMGEKGQGLSVPYLSENCIRVVTFGKALGCHGAIVLGSGLLRSYLINFARSFIYTTALPPHSLYAIKEAYKFFPQMDKERAIIYSLANYFNDQLIENGLKDEVAGNDTHIQSIFISNNHKVKQMSNVLLENGYDIRPILSPTVKKGTERLRISIHSYNTKEQIDEVIQILKISKDEQS